MDVVKDLLLDGADDTDADDREAILLYSLISC